MTWAEGLLPDTVGQNPSQSPEGLPMPSLCGRPLLLPSSKWPPGEVGPGHPRSTWPSFPVSGQLPLRLGTFSGVPGIHLPVLSAPPPPSPPPTSRAPGPTDATSGLSPRLAHLASRTAFSNLNNHRGRELPSLLTLPRVFFTREIFLNRITTWLDCLPCPPPCTFASVNSA